MFKFFVARVFTFSRGQLSFPKISILGKLVCQRLKVFPGVVLRCYGSHFSSFALGQSRASLYRQPATQALPGFIKSSDFGPCGRESFYLIKTHPPLPNGMFRF